MSSSLPLPINLDKNRLLILRICSTVENGYYDYHLMTLILVENHLPWQDSKGAAISDNHCTHLLDEVDSLLAHRADFSNRRLEQLVMAVLLAFSPLNVLL